MTRTLTRLLRGAILLTFISLPLAVEAQTPRPLEIEDQFALKRVGSPVVSSDGRWVAYTVSETSLEKESTETRIWMVSAQGGSPIPMTGAGGSSGNPQWSPDGKYLSFTASRDESKSQVWLLDRRGGEAQQLTEVEQGVSGYNWSPNGKQLLLTIRDPEPDSTWGEGKENAPKAPWVIDRVQFKRDGAGYLTGDRRTHLYVFDVAEKSLRQITSGDFDEGLGSWSPHGKLIAFVSNRTEDPDTNSNSDIWIVASDNTDKGQTLRRLTTNEGADSSPTWSPDGERIAYVTGIEPELIWYATRHLAIISSEGGNPSVLTRELDRNVSSPRFDEHGGGIYFRVEDSAEDHLAWIEPGSRSIERLVEGPLSVRGYDIGPAGLVATSIARINRPAEIYLGKGGQLERLTWTNDKFLETVQVARVENVTFTSRDGTEIEGFITFPIGYQEGLQYPLLLRIHGGPVSQFRHAFSFEAQLFAAKGYAVIQTNPRGSSGYGQDFSAALWADWGNKDFEDVMAGVDYAIERGIADPERLGVGGWSYGGILTNYVITKSERFKGAITGASEVLYAANYGHDHYQRQWEAELGLPWDDADRENWERISPFNDVEHVTTPTLIMGGEQDWNVPILNSEQLYQALRRLGVETQLVVYPGQGHGLRPPSYLVDRHKRYLEWYDRWVKPSSTRPITE